MKTKIVIIDNVPAQENLLENMLKQIGYESILKFRLIKDAMAVIEKEPDVGLIISEWDLPNKSGLDFLAQIKANDKLKHIPFILSFKTKPKEDVLGAVKSGVTGFLIKPYKLDVVKNKIQSIIKPEVPTMETLPPDGKAYPLNLENLDLREI